MKLTVKMDVDSLVDPTGKPSAAPIQLAPRRENLKGSRVLIYDNSKMRPEYGKWGVMATVIEKHLRDDEGISECDHLSQDPVALNYEGLMALADQISAKAYAGVVIALCDLGVTQNCSFIAARLESKGIPTVMVCTEEGIKLAQVNAQALSPGLPLCVVRQSMSADEAYVTEQTEAILPQIVKGLKRSNKEAGVAGEASLFSWNRDSLSSKSVDAMARDGSATVTPGLFFDEVYQSLVDARLTDGLPVVPPTRDRVDAMLAGTKRKPEEVIVDTIYPSTAKVTVYGLAVNAVMAGCLPEHLPIVITAFEAMAEPQYRLFQATVTGHPGGTAVVVSGPLSKRLKIESGQGCLGPGFRANSTIGRAISLCLINIARAIPGSSDLSSMGSPAKFCYCFAEDVDSNPWQALHEEVADSRTTTVTVFKCEGPRCLTDGMSKTPERLLEGFASDSTSVVANNAYTPANLLLILNPLHAALIANARWSKNDVKRFMFENVRNPRNQLLGRGVKSVRPPEFADLDPIPALRSPEDCLIVVAGGPGVQSMVSLPWGFSKAVTKAVRE